MRIILLIISCISFQVSFCQQLTFYKDVAPIILKKCVSCHKPGESAPFSLISYEDVSKRASFVKDVVESRFMPPWKADKHYVSYSNDRSLSDKEISLIAKWIDQKSPKGIETPEYTKSVKSILAGTGYNRKPDTTLEMKDSFLVKGDNKERFVIFKIPFELKDSFNVEAIEFISNNKKAIHHANYAIHSVPADSTDIYNTDSYINLTEDDRTKFDQYQKYRKTITYYGGWIPGTSYESYNKNFGWVMPKRGVILLTVHFAPTSIPENIVAGINLFFKKTPVTRKIKVISFGSGGIGQELITPPFYIWPNEIKTFRLQVTNPSEDQSVMYVWPHMHYIGQEFKAFAISPEGDTIKLAHIPKWDFRWQEIYRFKKLVKVPKGSTIFIEGTFNNRADNPFNPSNPPQMVFSSGDMKSTDEMLTLMMVFLPYKPGDENISLE